MINRSATYRIISRAVALLLLVGLLLPTAMQAKQLVDFCMMEISAHHEMMNDSHECCVSKTADQPNSESSHECKNGTICACTLDETLANESATVPGSSSSAIVLSQNGFNFMLTSPDELIYKDLFTHSNPDSPPLYLLYDTFLN